MIRRATPRDLAAITACAQDAYAKYVGRIGRKPAPMIADFARRIDDGIVHVSVTEDGAAADGALQGFIVFYRRDDHFHLENVAVAGRHQGKGVGKKLIDYCEAAGRADGVGHVELYTNAKMTENLTLYPRLGYVEVGRRREAGFDRVFYRKSLT